MATKKSKASDVRTVAEVPPVDRFEAMKRYVKVIGQGPGMYGVRFQVASSQFYFGDSELKLEEAEWFRDQLCRALDTLVEQVVGKIKRNTPP